jgi:hypothetical protein
MPRTTQVGSGGIKVPAAAPADPSPGVDKAVVATFAPLLESLLPEALDRALSRVLGPRMPRENGHYRVVLCGRFDGRLGADVMAFAEHHVRDAALVIGDADAVRVLYLADGRVVGADSDVIFERLGRTLRRRGAVTPEEADAVLELETSAGIDVAAGLLPRETLEFGLEQRTWEIGTNLPLVHGAHFLLVAGTPNLGPLPRLSISPQDLAIEGMRRYDEWRRSDHGRQPVSAGRPKDKAVLPDLPPPRAPSTARVPA